MVLDLPFIGFSGLGPPGLARLGDFLVFGYQKLESPKGNEAFRQDEPSQTDLDFINTP